MCWFNQGVAHICSVSAEWYTTAVDEFTEVAKLAWASQEQDRRNISQETLIKTMKRAKLFAEHERYTDATSDLKRQFMVEQLFPDEENPESIVRYAELHHWWNIEPSEKALFKQKVLDLYEAGRKLTDIAAAFNTSRDKVKRVLESAEKE
jgi:hypothetical protein